MTNEMSQETKNRLKSIPKAICSKCKTSRTQRNPMARCYECKKKFCFDHRICNQVNSKMKENDDVRDICEECQKEFGYESIK